MAEERIQFAPERRTGNQAAATARVDAKSPGGRAHFWWRGWWGQDLFTAT